MIYLLDAGPLVSALARCRVVTVDVKDFKVYRRRGRHPIPLLTPSDS